MPLEKTSASMQRQWDMAWKQVTAVDFALLKKVISHIAADVGRPQVSYEADVPLYDVKRLLDNNKARSQGGLKLLRYAVTWAQRTTSGGPSELVSSIERLKALHASLPSVDLEADHFFRHLESVNLAKERDCRTICDTLNGKYYSYRLSRHPGFIIRSHYDFKEFNPYDRVPNFVNKLSYLDEQDPPKLIKRTAVGHIFHMDHTYVSVGLVALGYGVTKSQRYDGLQINIFPEEQVRLHREVIDGLFLSFVYSGHYEVGPMKLARTTDGFKENAVGEFSIKEIHDRAPNIAVSDLMLDVSTLLEPSMTNERTGGSARDDMARVALAASLSFIFNQSGMRHFRPKNRS